MIFSIDGEHDFNDETEESNPYAIKIIDGNFVYKGMVTVQTLDGKIYRRVVKDDEGGLYVIIHNTKYYYSDVID